MADDFLPSLSTPPPVLDRHMRLALWLSAGALLGLCLWLGWQWWRGVDRSREPLTWAVLAPPPDQPMRPWNAIVIHHSASLHGSTASFDRDHRKRGWDGIGYDFLIGNGIDMPEGQVDATFRWRQQREGAHAGSSPLSQPYNDLGIGICLVGNFDVNPPTAYQEQRLARLCAVLIRHVPGLSLARIIGHRDVPGKETKCPGQYLDIEHLRSVVRQQLEQPE